MTRTRAIWLGLGLCLTLAVPAAAVIEAAPVVAQALADRQPSPPKDDAKCSTCDGFHLMLQGDYPRAMHIFRLRAAEGDSMAMYNLGWMYQHGLGMPPDMRQAIVWYGKSGDRGNGRALVNLWDIYTKGLGVPVDHELAHQYLQKAVGTGEPEALTQEGRRFLLGDGYPMDYGRAIVLFRAGVAGGDPTAMNEIGFVYQHGLGVKPDAAAAWCWYQRAIANGYDGSIKHLGELTAAGLMPTADCSVVSGAALPGPAASRAARKVAAWGAAENGYDGR